MKGRKGSTKWGAINARPCVGVSLKFSVKGPRKVRRGLKKKVKAWMKMNTFILTWRLKGGGPLSPQTEPRGAGKKKPGM